MYACVYAYVCACVHVCAYMPVHACVSAYVCVSVCVCVHRQMTMEARESDSSSGPGVTGDCKPLTLSLGPLEDLEDPFTLPLFALHFETGFTKLISLSLTSL